MELFSLWEKRKKRKKNSDRYLQASKITIVLKVLIRVLKYLLSAIYSVALLMYIWNSYLGVRWLVTQRLEFVTGLQWGSKSGFNRWKHSRHWVNILTSFMAFIRGDWPIRVGPKAEKRNELESIVAILILF